MGSSTNVKQWRMNLMMLDWSWYTKRLSAALPIIFDAISMFFPAFICQFVCTKSQFVFLVIWRCRVTLRLIAPMHTSSVCHLSEFERKRSKNWCVILKRAPFVSMLLVTHTLSWYGIRGELLWCFYLVSFVGICFLICAIGVFYLLCCELFSVCSF